MKPVDTLNMLHHVVWIPCSSAQYMNGELVPYDHQEFNAEEKWNLLHLEEAPLKFIPQTSGIVLVTYRDLAYLRLRITKYTDVTDFAVENATIPSHIVRSNSVYYKGTFPAAGFGSIEKVTINGLRGELTIELLDHFN